MSHPQRTANPDTTLEVLATSIGATDAALAGGAGRIELCGNLLEGGTTPSAGTIEASVGHATAVGVPVMVMIRPRGGGFVYDRDEASVMAADLRRALALGAAGVVLGALDESGEVDSGLTRRLVDLAAGAAVTFHRAVDAARDPRAAAAAAFALGAHRVLTSGGARTAPAGAGVIAAMVAEAPPGRVVMAGTGVTSANVTGLVAATGVREVHASATVLVTRGRSAVPGPDSGAGVDSAPVPGWPAGGWPTPDPAEVAALRRALARAAARAPAGPAEGSRT